MIYIMDIRLKELREKENLSLNKLKRILKEKYNVSVSDSQLMYYENGIRKPRNEEIWSCLADYFGVTVAYLLGYKTKAEYSSFNDQEYQNELKKLAFSLAHLELLISDSQIKHLHALLKGMSNDNTLLNDVKTVKNKDKYYTEILKRNREYNLLNEIKEDTELLEILKLLNEKL